VCAGILLISMSDGTVKKKTKKTKVLENLEDKHF
jgi:hypothetical protein